MDADREQWFELMIVWKGGVIDCIALYRCSDTLQPNNSHILLTDDILHIIIPIR